MAKDTAQLRDKALRLGRSAFEKWEAQRIPQAAAAAGRAETVLFRLICGDPQDLGLCSAFGEIAALHTACGSGARVKSLAYIPITLARTSLWALDRADPCAGDPLKISQAVRKPIAETTFPQFDGNVRQLSPRIRMTAAADARFRLAHLLASYQPARDKNPMTPGQLNGTLGNRDKFYRSDEELLGHFHTASCADLDATAEARTLAEEAVEIYRAIATEPGPDDERDALRAEEQLQAVHRKLS
jgi:hypothetical protein